MKKPGKWMYCVKCNKKLIFVRQVDGEIKCPKCGHVQVVYLTKVK